MSGWDVLERHFAGLTPDEVGAELAAVRAQGATPPTAGSAEYLTRRGGPELDSDSDGNAVGDVHQRRVLTAARTLSDTVRSALTMDQAADLLQVSRSRLSDRISAGTVWAFTLQGRRWLPQWQFTADGHVVPGLSQIVAAIPDSLHPLAVEGFMTTRRQDFDDRSPIDWLASGGAPDVIAEWLIGMAHG